ncbi:MAG TPA: EAL domain-containing protein [Terriglobales bacterium]|nr:EAL domain-containing protein [Terriglobales bacterium]
MSATAVPNILALGFLVLIFGSILRRRATDQLQFWFFGWVLMLLHFITELFAPVLDLRVVKTLSACSIETAGVLFLIAVSKVCSSRRRRWMLATVIALPALSYSVAVAWNITYKSLFYGLLAIAIPGSITLVWTFYKKLSLYVVSVLAGIVSFGTMMTFAVHDGDFASVIRMAQALLFVFCGTLYFRRFSRWSVGVFTASGGFLAWAVTIAFPHANNALERFVDAPLSNIATYCVALGMVLTLLEEQIQEAVTASERVSYQAQHDVLTGLPNRVLFEDRLTQALARSRRANTKSAVLCIDLDRFKQVNDTFGHHFGDLYLQSVVERFRSRLRETDTLARTGGDEFTAVLTDLKTIEGASYVAKELLSTLTEPLNIEGCSIEASASIGVAVFPDDAENAEALRRGADQAMYWAKSRGRNRHECFAGDARDTLDIEEQMRIALDEGKFELFYQPLYRPDRSIEALEALLRFRHPRLGMVPPSRFIPVAEECGLIVPIGDWVLQQVCHQIKEWREKFGLSARVAVNVSALQFGRTDFAACVSRNLARTGVDPACIELELTESLVMNNVQESSRQMTKLKQLGVNMSVDDFGTGYSSLSYLHELPIDTLKIDRSFIEKVSDPNGTRPIVEAVVSLAKTLHMRTVAEGVETNEQLDIVHRVGCDLVQGFLLSRPVPVAQIPDLLRASMAVKTSMTQRAGAAAND